MNAYKKYKNRLERFLQTERGKRFINFAYSFGAAIVILGAMFKLLHFPFGNEMLFIGMVTECIVFVLSAFDTPIRDYQWEQVFPALSGNHVNGLGDDTMDVASPTIQGGSGAIVQGNGGSVAQGNGGSVVQENGGSVAQGVPGAIRQGSTSQIYGNPNTVTTGAGAQESDGMVPQGGQEADLTTIPPVAQLSSYSEEYGRQMENLNRTLSGLNSIYELQLKSVSSQIGTIEQINQGLARFRTMYGDALPDGSIIKTETEKMADQLRELNEVYARMLHAMTVNRYENPNNTNL